MSRVSAVAGYELWADTWDATPSPIVALEHRLLLPWIDIVVHDSAPEPPTSCPEVPPTA